MKTITRNIIISSVFVIFVMALSLSSGYRLMKYYINDEKVNNDSLASVGGSSKLESDYISNFALRYQLVDLNGAFCRMIGKSELNSVVRLDNGYLSRKFEYVDEELYNEGAWRTKQFQDKLKERGIGYVWFTVPYNSDKYNPQMPLGVEDYGNDNLDRLTEAMRRNGVNTVDLREELHEQGLETYDIFYKTDHHWSTKGGFWAYRQIVEYIEQNYDTQVDESVKNIENYDVITYKKWHLGSNGQRTGRYFAGIDDFDLIVPKFDSMLYLGGTEYGGPMQEVMYDMEPLEKRDVTQRMTYDNVLRKACAPWHNDGASSDLRVMVISDSMARSVMPFMALSFKDAFIRMNWIGTDCVDTALIEEYNPDVVVSLNYIFNTGESAFAWKMIEE